MTILKILMLTEGTLIGLMGLLSINMRMHKIVIKILEKTWWIIPLTFLTYFIWLAVVTYGAYS